MKIYAIYRMYYGEDFIRPSILSVLPFVDKVFIFRAFKPFGHVTHFLDGTKIPRVLDKCDGEVADIKRDAVAVNVIYDDKCSGKPDNQFTNLYNIYIAPNYEPPDAVLIMEPDMVWPKGELAEFIMDLKIHDIGSLNANQVEFWHNNKWRIPKRKRWSAILHRLSLDRMVPTGKSGETMMTPQSSATVHNFGFCLKPRNMMLKVEIAKAYGQKIDAEPYENWYKEVWYDWHPKTNNKNLEISKRYRNYIPYAESCEIEVSKYLKDHQWNPSIFTPRPE